MSKSNRSLFTGTLFPSLGAAIEWVHGSSIETPQFRSQSRRFRLCHSTPRVQRRFFTARLYTFLARFLCVSIVKYGTLLHTFMGFLWMILNFVCLCLFFFISRMRILKLRIYLKQLGHNFGKSSWIIFLS